MADGAGGMPPAHSPHTSLQFSSCCVLAWTPAPASGDELYGLGWTVAQLSGGTRPLMHAGDPPVLTRSATQRGKFALAPERRIGEAVLANSSTMEKTEIAADVIAIMLSGEPECRSAAPDWRHTTTFVPDRFGRE